MWPAGRYIKCPFYIDDRRKSITCEDVCRHYSSLDDKWAWMDMYCDLDWMSCPYAVDLNEAYYRKEKGEEKALEEEKIKAQKKEIRSLSTKLGTAEKKLEKLSKINENLQRQKELFYGKYKKAYDELEDYKKNESKRYFAMATLYEDRIAYLIDTYCDGRLAEADVKAWAEGKEYALTFDGKAKEPIWVVKIREETDADEDVSEPVSGAAEDEGTEAEK